MRIGVSRHKRGRPSLGVAVVTSGAPTGFRVAAWKLWWECGRVGEDRVIVPTIWEGVSIRMGTDVRVGWDRGTRVTPGQFLIIGRARG